MKNLFILFAVLIVTSCGYKKSVGDKVYIQYAGKGEHFIFVAHSNPDCPDIDSYREETVKDNSAFTVCAKCVKEEDVSKILK